MDKLSDFINKSMKDGGWTQRGLAEKAHASFRTIADMRSGKLEEELSSGDISERRRRGIAESITRVLVALEVDAELWLKQLGLDDVQVKAEVGKLSERIASKAFLSSVLSADDVKLLSESQALLGKTLTIELALKILRDKRES